LPQARDDDHIEAFAGAYFIVRSSTQLDERWGAATQVSFAHTFIEKGENALPANYLVQSHRGPYTPT
jgi:hypothetical protein